MKSFMSKQALLVILTGMLSAVAVADIDEVSTSEGNYRSVASEFAAGVSVFKGLTFAAPPLQELRWKPPAQAIEFSGTRVAERAGPACWQARNGDDSVYARGNLGRSEDCLYLNVFSGAAAASERLPVMVWFHGGSNTAGHGGAQIFEGSNLAARGAVVVTANYRLGPLGFLAHPALTNESPQGASGNYGLLDQIAALHWVQDNIAEFGGDPERVTIFGQSAGGEDVCLLMASPLSEGLIHRVIGQSPSGGCVRLQRGLEGGADSAHARGTRFVEAMGITGSGSTALAAMRELSPQQIIGTTRTEGNPNGPIVDGWVLPEPPAQLFASGNYNRVPMMSGALSDEYFGLQAGAAEISETDLDNYLTRAFGVAGTGLRADYAELITQSPVAARKTIAGDNGFIRTARDWARLVSSHGDPAYVYYFSRAVPVFRLYVPERPELNGNGGARSLGAYHSGELAYMFDNLDAVGIGWEEADHMLSEIVADYWFNFASSGNPNGAGLPDWPTYDSAVDAVQILDAEVSNAQHPRKRFMDRIDTLVAP